MNPGSIVSQLTSPKEPQRAIYWRLASIFLFAVKCGSLSRSSPRESFVECVLPHERYANESTNGQGEHC